MIYLYNEIEFKIKLLFSDYLERVYLFIVKYLFIFNFKIFVI